MPSLVISNHPAVDAAAEPALVERAAPVHGISIERTFETAHRLPQLPGKCTSLHGHSWQVTIGVTARGLGADSTAVEYGAFKAGVRGWIDTNLDHGTMFGTGDPLVQPVIAAGCKVFRFGLTAAPGAGPQDLAAGLARPAQILAGLPVRRRGETKSPLVRTEVIASMPIPRRARAHDDGIFAQPAQARDDDLVARRSVSFTCRRGHEFVIPFAADAVVPATWECRQHGISAGLANATPRQPVKTRSHGDLVLERRLITELAQLLNQQLTALRAGQLVSVEQWLQQQQEAMRRERHPTAAAEHGPAR